MQAQQPQEPALIGQVKRLRVDAMLGKKKHFNAADRKRPKVAFLRWIPIAISLMLASAFFFQLQQYAAVLTQFIGTLAALLAAFLSWLHTAYGSVPEDHHRVASEFLDIQKQCEDLLASYKDHVTDLGRVQSRLCSLRSMYKYVNDSAHNYPTNRTDYDEAKDGFRSGEECYLDEELHG